MHHLHSQSIHYKNPKQANEHADATNQLDVPNIQQLDEISNPQRQDAKRLHSLIMFLMYDTRPGKRHLQASLEKIETTGGLFSEARDLMTKALQGKASRLGFTNDCNLSAADYSRLQALMQIFEDMGRQPVGSQSLGHALVSLNVTVDRSHQPRTLN